MKDNEILTGSVDGYIRCYDIRMGRLRSDCIAEPISNVCYSNDKNCILASTLDGRVYVFNKFVFDLTPLSIIYLYIYIYIFVYLPNAQTIYIDIYIYIYIYINIKS